MRAWEKCCRWLPLAAVSCLIAPDAVLAQDPITPIQPVLADPTSTTSVSLGSSGQVIFDREVKVDLRLGPFTVRPGVRVGAGVQSNVRASGGGNITLTASLFVDAGPSLDVLLPIGRHLFSVSGQAIYRAQVAGESVTSLNTWLYSGVGAYQYAGNRFGAAATYSIRKHQEGLLAFLEEGPTVEITDTVQRVDVLTKTAGARTQFDLSSRLRLQIQGSQTRREYDDTDLDGFDVAKALDRDETTVDVLLDRRLTSRTTLGLFATARRSKYRSVDGFRDNDNLRGGLRAGFGSGGGRLTGNLEAGVETRTVDDPTREGFTGPYTFGRVRLQVQPRVGLSLSADVRTKPTLWEENAYSINTGAGLFVDVRVLRQLGLGAGVGYDRIRFPEPASFLQEDGSILTAKRTDQLWVYRGSIAVGVFGIGLTVEGGYFNRSSNFDIGGSRGYFFTLRLSAGVSVSRRL